MFTKVQSISNFIVSVPAGVAITDVRMALEKELGIKVQKMSLVSSSISPLGIQGRVMFEDRTSALSGQPQGEGVATYAVTATTDITADLTIVKQAVKDAERAEAEKARVRAAKEAEEKARKIEEAKKALAALEGEKAELDEKAGAKRERKAKKEKEGDE